MGLLTILAPIAVAIALPLPVSQTAAPQAGETDIVEAEQDRHERMTVAVQIGASGPYRFLVDTGSERTVVDGVLAGQLGLKPAGQGTLIGMAGLFPVDLVELDEITMGRSVSYGLVSPLLKRQHIGADGIIGLDSLQGRRVLLDFTENRMAVTEVGQRGENRGFEIVVRARERRGQLIVTSAKVDGITVDVVIDTGAQYSIGNRALQQALFKRKRQTQTAVMDSVTGQSIVADIGIINELRVGAVKLSGAVMAFAEAPPFAHLGLQERPAMLLGMRELRAFDRVAIDFEKRQILFDVPDPDFGVNFGSRTYLRGN